VFSGQGVEGVQLYVLGFRYPFNNFSPSISVENMGVHVMKAILQFQNIMEVKFLVPDDHKSEEPGSLDADISSWLCQLLRIKAVSFGVEDKKTFKEYYKQSLKVTKSE
jgi:hypothetical protein